MNKNNLVLVIGLLSFLYVLFAIANPLNMAVYAQKQENTIGKPIEFLAIQTAKSGSLSQINETAYTLEFNNVSPNTILFSDRPYRIVESIPTSDFISNWTVGLDSFAVDPPNSVLVFEDVNTGSLDNQIIELHGPTYHKIDNSLIYAITVKDNKLANKNELGQSVLIIDATPGDYIFEDNVFRKLQE